MVEEIISQKTINEKFLDNLSNSLLRLEEYERLMWEGCNSLLDYVQNPTLNLASIKYKNYRLFIVEFQIILNNWRKQIDKKTYLDLHMGLKKVLDIEKEAKGFLKEETHQQHHTTKNTLKPKFYTVRIRLSSLRAILIESLWSILTPKAKESEDSMPK